MSRTWLLIAVVACGKPEPATAPARPAETPSTSAPPPLTSEPASQSVREDLSRAARKAVTLPVCTEVLLRDAGARGPISALADVAIRKGWDFDPGFLSSGWFAPRDAASRFDAGSKVVIVYLASEARFPTTASTNGIFKGRGVALAIDDRRPICEIPIAFESSDDGSINYHEHFNRALVRAALGEYTPMPR